MQRQSAKSRHRNAQMLAETKIRELSGLAPGLEPGTRSLRDILLALIFQGNFSNCAKIRALEINGLQWKLQLRERVKVRKIDASPLSPPRSACTTKIMDGWPRTACGQIQSRHSDWQVETPWPSTSRIEIEHPANSLDPGPMRVAANDDVNPARDWFEPERFEVVRSVHRGLASGSPDIAPPSRRYRHSL
jgi:hypothetical protein